MPSAPSDDQRPGAAVELEPALRLLLGRVEALAGELGRIETANVELAAALGRLEARLRALGVVPGTQLATSEFAPLMPLTQPVAAPPPATLARLVERMESLGLALGRADIHPDYPPGSAPPQPVVTQDESAGSLVVTDAPEPESEAGVKVPQVAALRPSRSRSDAAAAAMRFSIAALSAGAARFRPIRPSDAPLDQRDTASQPEHVSPAPNAAAPLPAPELAAPPRQPLAERLRQRLGWVRALGYGAVAIAVVAALAAIVALANSNDPATTPTRSATGTIGKPPATLEPVNGSDTRVPGVYGFIDTPTVLPLASPSPTVQPTATATPTRVSTSTPTPRPTATRTPTPLPTATPTPAPTDTPKPTPEPPPPTAIPVNPTPGLGATRADIEMRLGPAGVTRSNGVVEYQNGTITVRYSNDGRVLWISLNQRLTPSQSRESADAFAASWRPPDATFQRTDSSSATLERQIYASPAMTAALGGGDVRGRNPNLFVEEFQHDPASGNIVSITLAVGAAF